MKLSKAIELVREDTNHPTVQFTADLVDAEKLLIEAGKELKLHRQFMHNSEFQLLPGETPE